MYECRRESVILLRIVDPGFHTDIFKSSVWLLMIQRVTLAGQTARSAHHRNAAKLAKVLAYTARFVCFSGTPRQIVEINFKIAGNEKIQSAIAVIIAPGSTRAPA